jgi:hypothetical protein
VYDTAGGVDDLVAASLEGIGVAAIQDHHGARLGETGGQCIANAATGPSDEAILPSMSNPGCAVIGSTKLSLTWS